MLILIEPRRITDKQRDSFRQRVPTTYLPTYLSVHSGRNRSEYQEEEEEEEGRKEEEIEQEEEDEGISGICASRYVQ